MFDLNPLNLPDAQLEHLIMLVVAGVLGFLIGYSSRQRTIRQLEGELASTDQALENCRKGPAPTLAGTGNEEAIVLNRIRRRANEIDLDRIGRALASEADDLKIIVGIGPFLERKLHAIGIYTFRQIANFTDEDVEKVNDIIEFFPGRIRRDEWVRQAAQLVKQH
jgi:predicted flap endonuclease-1-like 5' DNA nuclease